MATNKFDPEDIGMLVLGILSAGVMVGIVTVEAFGFSMADTYSFSSMDITLAWVVTLGTTAGILVTNDNTDLLSADGYKKLQASQMEDYYVYTILGFAALLVGWVFVPEVSDFFMGSDMWGAVFIALSAAAQVALGWMY